MKQGSLKRIVLKLGTKVLTTPDGHLAEDRLETLLCDLLKNSSKDLELIIVSSGSVGIGQNVLKLTPPLTLHLMQACAAVGQSLLMKSYRDFFSGLNRTAGQILVTADDFSQRQKYLTLRKTMETLLSLKVIPVVNENDSVSTRELKHVHEDRRRSFADNDNLAALVASKMDADLLIILTDVDGLYDKNPYIDKSAQKISLISDLSDLNKIEANGSNDLGRGGMDAKIKAIRTAAMSGVPVVVASGLKSNVVSQILDDFPRRNSDEPVGTLIKSTTQFSHRRRWIGFSGMEGVIVINEGARVALVERFASLLPIGVTQVLGSFEANQVVSIEDEKGNEIGRGMSHFSSEELKKIMGLQSQEISKVIGPTQHDVVIQRDDLVVFQEGTSA